MNFIEELRWRGMLHNMTPETEQALMDNKLVGYIGFDPTAASLTLGNYVQVMLLTLFQKAGHSPIVLMGGATGRIGDPSGKDKERELKSFDVLDNNLSFQKEQIKKFLNFEGDNPAIIVNNHDFYKNMNVLDFLRDVGKTLTVSYMMSKDSVKKRLETGLSFTEFSYQLLQAYDFQVLNSKYNCSIQMGGSDQWGNITSGTEFVRKNLKDAKVYAVTTPLLTKSDGKKFGKSEQGNIWLDPKMTSPYNFYQFWINGSDADMGKFFRYFSFKTKVEIENLEAEHAENPRELKRILAEELTIRVHSQEAYNAVLQVSEILFNKNASKEQLMSLSLDALNTVRDELKSVELPLSVLAQPCDIIKLLVEHSQLLASNGDLRRAIKNNAISINKTKIADHNHLVKSSDLIKEKYIMVENGKKNKYMLVFTS